MEQATSKKRGWRRAGRILIKTLLWIFLLIIVLFLLILTPPVQNFITRKATNYLEKKLETRVEIGRLFFTLGGNIALDDIYVEDRQKDTLFSAGELRVNLSLYKIIFDGELDIKSVRMDDATAKIKRQLPDTSFNFQFIIDAFGSGKEDTVQVSDSSAPMAISVGTVEFNTLRLVYNDVVTGNDVEANLGHFDTKVEKFDLEKLHFIVPQVTIRGLTARMNMVKPLVIPVEKIEEVKRENAGSSSPVLQLEFRNIDIEKTKINYNDSVGLLYAAADIGNLNLKPKTIDLEKAVFDLGNIVLEKTTASVKMGKSNTVPVVSTTGSDTSAATANGVTIRLASLGINEVNLAYDDENAARATTGMDYSHINAGISKLEVSNFVFNKDSIAAVIVKANLKEQSGFQLQELQTSFLYTDQQASLEELYLKTPGTELKRKALIRCASMESLKTDIGSMQLDLQLENSQLAVRDVLLFVPSLQQQPAFADPGATWYLNGDISGTISNLQLRQLQIQGLKDTRVDVSGSIAGLPEMDKLRADLTIREISSSRRDMQLFLPRNTLPSNITLPGRMSLAGTIKGGMADLATNLGLKTDLGDAQIKGRLQQVTDAQHAVYHLAVQTRSLDLGTILQNKENLGPISATFTAKGKGFDPKTANAVLNGQIHSAVLKGYTYKDLALDGSIADQQAKLNAAIQDPNIHFALNASADLSREYPAVQLNAVIDSIKTLALHLTPNELIYRGKINADFPITNPDSLEGKLFVTESLLVQNGKRIQLDTVQLIAGGTDTSRYMLLNTDLVNAQLQGRYKLTELGNVFQQAIQPYFEINDGDSILVKSPYDFTLDAVVINGPVLQSFAPDLKRMDSVTLRSRFSDADGWNAAIHAPALEIGTNKINGLEIVAGTSNNQAIDVKASVAQLKTGSIQLDNTTVTAALADNKIDFNLNIKDEEQDKYNVSGLFAQPQQGQYEFSLKPEGLILNGDSWTIVPSNRILIGDGSLNARSFVLGQGSQQLSINSVSSEPNAPMEVSFSDFRIATLTGFVQPDSTLVDGRINGRALVKDVMVDPVFTSDLTITDLNIKRDTVGDVKVLVNNQTANTYAADITISGRGNDVKLAGSYNTASSTMNMDLDIRTLPMTTAQAFSAGAIREASGSVNGKFTVTGGLDKPVVNGDLNFNKAAFNLAMLNNYMTIDQEKLQVNSQGISFNKFEIKDSASNKLMLDGTAATSNFVNYKFDLDIRSDNFRALNSTKKDNQLFYGQLYFNSNLKVTGTEAAPVIDGRLKINEKTKMTVVLPQNDPGIADREGVIEFIDMDAPPSDSLFTAMALDSLNTMFTGAEISVNLEIDKAADLTLIVDEGNGDFLNVKGEALLNATVNPAGEIILAGTYDLEEGAYELSFNAIRRRFDIQKGSKITWGGEPTDADVNITAKYIANTAPLDLVKGQLGEDITAAERNTYLQKLPFEVMLKMEGKLLKPKIGFDIILPDNKSYIVSNDIITNVRTKLDQLRQEEGEMNKQVFALLLLKRFVAENPFNASGGGGLLNAGALARQSVSKLMTEQLNRLASDLVKGVDLNFDVEASEDYTSGKREDRTDLNVGLSKRLLNDRLTVTVGSNFELEAPQNSSQQASNIAGNIALNYRLSQDGRYQLRAYRKNEFQGVIDGYIIETGVGFIITLDYNRFREIFQKKKIERQRQKRREERLKKEAQANPEALQPNINP